MKLLKVKCADADPDQVKKAAVAAFMKVASAGTKKAVKEGAELFSNTTYKAIKAGNMALAVKLAGEDAEEMNEQVSK